MTAVRCLLPLSDIAVSSLQLPSSNLVRSLTHNMPPRLRPCFLRGLAGLRGGLLSPVHIQHRAFAQSTRSSRRPVARSALRQRSPSSSSAAQSLNTAPDTTEEHRESSPRTVRRSTPVSVSSLAASRRAAFTPQSQQTLSDDTSPTPTQNAAAILDILAALDRPLPLRQLERLIHTLLALTTANHIPPLTHQHYLTALRSLTRRPLTVTRHLHHYTTLTATTPPASSPYHPAHNDTRLMARLKGESDRMRMRRAFCLLAFGVRVDMAVQLLALMQAGQSLPKQVLQLAERVLELAGHRYMAARVRKARSKVSGGEDVVKLVEANGLSSDVRRAYPLLLASSEAMRAMTAAQTQRLAAELEQLSAGTLNEDDHLLLLLASVRIGQEVTTDEVESLSAMLPLASQKLEMSRESQEDGILRWRVMELKATIITHMQQQGTQPTQLIHDELFRIYANCAAIQPALQLLATLRSTDSLHYRYLLRTASLLQRWEQPHIYALQLLRSLPANSAPDVSMYNDVLRACDRAEQYEQLFATVREMRERGVEANDVTHQYVTSAGVQCGEEGRGVVEVVGRDEADKAEWRRELEEEMAVVEQMGVKDFVAGVDKDEVKEVEDEEVMAELRRVKEKLKAELAEEMKLVDNEPLTSNTAATATGESVATAQSEVRTV